MAYEVWIFSNEPQFKPRGGIVAIEVAPREYGYGDAEQLANKLTDAYATDGLDVSTVVRQEASY